MFPDIHDEHRREAGNVAVLMSGDPRVREPAVVRILITDGPADAPHFPHAGEIRPPAIETVE
ncbi:MAG: hypothetical protein NTNFB02_16640 [Nitrospira sp.]